MKSDQEKATLQSLIDDTASYEKSFQALRTAALGTHRKARKQRRAMRMSCRSPSKTSRRAVRRIDDERQYVRLS